MDQQYCSMDQQYFNMDQTYSNMDQQYCNIDQLFVSMNPILIIYQSFSIKFSFTRIVIYLLKLIHLVLLIYLSRVHLLKPKIGLHNR